MRFAAAVLALCLAAPGSIAARAAEEALVDVPQGWTASQKQFWYNASQGSRLIPLVWLQALEQPGSSSPFLDPVFLETFRYLPRDGRNGGPLPVGFAIDRQDDTRLSFSQLRWRQGQSSSEPWVGMNCSACHSNDITYRGRRMRIEGAPTLADFQSFIEAVNQALVQARDDDAKWGRFAAAVLKASDGPANRQLLRAALSKVIDRQLKLEAASRPLETTPGSSDGLRYGFGRLDAIGHIFNKVALVNEAADQTFSPADAPVSYPFLWNIHQFDKVQWNGMAKNTPVTIGHGTFDLGALGRNTGEMIGVFGDVRLTVLPLAQGYRSSVDVADLRRLDDQIRTLRPPAWPSVFPAIDETRKKAGGDLFATKGCAGCHGALSANDLSTKVATTMALFKDTGTKSTDIWMACNAYTADGRVGLLWGIPRLYLFGAPYLASRAPVADMLGTTVAGVLIGRQQAVAAAAADAFFASRRGPQFTISLSTDLSPPGALPAVRNGTKEDRAKRCLSEESPILGYKGRPLTGIWATAPYLHNGSVPTLHDLLLPPDQRPTSFHVGSREFDPNKVGFVTEASDTNSFEFRTRDASNRMIDGNSNAGHDYGNASLTEGERAALLEYLKSL